MKVPEKPISFWVTLEGINSQFEFQILQVSKLVVSQHHQHCFLGKPTWAFLEGAHKHGAGDYWGTGHAQSWGMPRAKLSLALQDIFFHLWSLEPALLWGHSTSTKCLPGPFIPRCSRSCSRRRRKGELSPEEPAAISLPRLRLKPPSCYIKDHSTTFTFSQFMKSALCALF